MMEKNRIKEDEMRDCANSGQFYAMELDEELCRRYIADYPPIAYSGISFTKGQKLTVKIPEPLVLPLRESYPDDGRNGIPEYYPRGQIPFFCGDLVEALNEFGVNNIDYYNAIITDPDDNKEYANYKAGNVIGLFDDLQEIAKQKLSLARYKSYIVVSEDLKEHLLTKKFSFLIFEELYHVGNGEHYILY